jgi:hypothetical protein
MMIKNTKIEKKQKFNNEILFPQLKGNGLGIGEYINQLEHNIDTLTIYLKLQKDEINKLNKIIKNE